MPYRAPDQRAVTPQHKGRYPGYDVLDEVHRWDDVTAGVVLARLAPVTDLSFFTMTENAAAGALFDLLLGQDSEPRVPVVALVDGRLAAGETDGWHYDDLPPDPQAWRETLRLLDVEAREVGGINFVGLPVHQQCAVIQQVQDQGEKGNRWHELPAAQVWSLWTRYACAAFYSHPWAWNEIGFGGPAYPRGYKNPGGRERWEIRDEPGEDPVVFAQRVERARSAQSAIAQDRS